MIFHRLFTLLIILSLLISPSVVAETDFDDEFEDERFRAEIRGDGVRVEFDDDDFKAEFRDENGEFRAEFRSDRDEFRSEFKDDRYEERFERDDFDDIDEEDFIFESVFEFLDEEIDERDVIHLCDNPEDIVDFIMDKVDQNIGALSHVCDELGERETSCEEEVEFHCSHFGGGNVEDARDDLERLEILAFSCPVNEEAMIDLCVFYANEEYEYQLEFLEEDCGYQWEDWGEEQDKYCEYELEDAQCDKDEFMEDCLIRWGAFECPFIPFPSDDCSGYWDQEYDDRGCIVDYFCVEKEIDEGYEEAHEETPVEILCLDVWEPVCGANGITYANDCVAEQAGVPYDYGECVVCQLSEEEAELRIQECLAHDGAPEKHLEGDCIQDVICTLPEIVEETGLDVITGEVVRITGRVLDDFEDFERECKHEWERQEDYCEDLPEKCGREHFIDNCVSNEKKYIEREIERSERRCKIDSRSQVRQMSRECSRMEEMREECFEEGKERCERFEGSRSDCESRLTKENFREYILEEAEKRCVVAPQFIREEVYSGNTPRKVIEKILDLKEAGVPGRFTGVLDEEVEDLQDVTDDLEELGEAEEGKGLGYKLRLFLGFAKKIEEGEINSLQASKERLQASIDSLSLLAEQVDDPVMAEILKEQVKELERQKDDIDDLIDQKSKKSKGLLQLFGLLG